MRQVRLGRPAPRRAARARGDSRERWLTAPQFPLMVLSDDPLLGHLRERGQVSTVTCGGCGRSPMDKEQNPASPKCQSERAAETPIGRAAAIGVLRTLTP